MTLLDEQSPELGTVTAEVLTLDEDRTSPTHRQWIPNGESFEASVLDLSGTEVYSLGKPIDTEMIRLFADFDGDALPVAIKQRVRVEGKDWQVLSAKRIPALQDEAGVIYELSRAT